ncbi:MAG: hypothetical protein KA144_01680 [Xanthomonadaceae bacterium]|nr:hypothetical protein [Xanthomonadaceae bacterium]
MIALVAWRVRQKIVRMRHVREAALPPGLFDKLRRRRPDIDPKQFPLLERALRDFFAAYLRSGYKPVSMPSQAADELWHEFILYTRHYQAFCDKAFGRFLHHTPAVVLSKAYDRNVGLRRVWWHTCKLEGIDPRKASRLPLLFALDTQLALADGFHYALDCGGIRDRTDGGGGSQCAADMSDSSFDGTTDGLGDGDGGGGDGGDGGGDSGCGGGCGGD